MRSTSGGGAKSPRSLRSADRELGTHVWLEIALLDATYVRAGEVDGRCNCDAASAECSWTQLGEIFQDERLSMDEEAAQEASE